MASLRLQAISKARKLGAVVSEWPGHWYEFNLEAPAGYCWEEQCHEDINEYSGKRPDAEFWIAILSRLDHLAPQLCTTTDCDWCADTAAGIPR